MSEPLHPQTAFDVGGQKGETEAQCTIADEKLTHSPLVQAWGVLGNALLIGHGVVKLLPLVRAGLADIQYLWQWLLLVATLLFFAYAEGYKGFALSFCPRLVCRAWVVSQNSVPMSTSIPHKLLAPLFCFPFFHATKKRMIISWVLTAVIIALIVAVKQLPNPYRAIVDAGVVVGLSIGVATMLLIFFMSLRRGRPPKFDPCLPEGTPYRVYQ